ncbi:MAG: hypothetical protein KKA73_16470 [Chloroflexi bacterium]|nr:hypothetical protein [Chloroflexota bacterium]MBU1749280.1 hypothetical protein [Chloroflexota bacterium]
MANQWAIEFCNYIHAEDSVRELHRQRTLWETKKRRTLELYREGALERVEYDAYMTEVETKLAELGNLENLQPVNEQQYLESLLAIWQIAAPREQHGWIVQFVRQAYINSETNLLVWIEPEPTFQDLFREAGLSEPEPGFFDVSAFGEGLKRPNRRTKIAPDQVAEMRRLRQDNPEEWSLRRLGEKFGISHERVNQLLKQTD